MTVDPVDPGSAGPMANPPGMPAGPAMLAGTADRERAIDVLKAGFTEGRLSKAEFDERAARAYAARTYADLAPLVADLPAGPAAAYKPPAAPVPSAMNRLAVASLICGLAEIPTLGLSALPAVILGTRAREQIRRTGQRGDGLAVAGLILGWTAIRLFFAAVIIMMIWLALPPGPGSGGPIGG
jgi:hypothetical protein